MEAKEYFKNPQKINAKQTSDLAIWMQELGDLGCVVHDLNSNEIISGNQRSKIVDLNSCEIEIVKEYEKPTAQGTVKQGYIIYEGERFGYRAVRWTPEKCEKANIIANKAGGEWDMKILGSEFDKTTLIDFGFDFKDFDNDDTRSKAGKAEYEQMEAKMNEHHDYIVLLFDDKNDFLNACNVFDIKKVIYSSSEKKTDIGTGRVINGKKALENAAKKNNYQSE